MRKNRGIYAHINEGVASDREAYLAGRHKHTTPSELYEEINRWMELLRVVKNIHAQTRVHGTVQEELRTFVLDNDMGQEDLIRAIEERIEELIAP
jgi:hypothetical protein